LSINELAATYQVSPSAIQELIRALRTGGGQAQFNHPDLGGMGQWGGGNMIMIGDMFNHGLKDRVASCAKPLQAILTIFQKERNFAAPADIHMHSSKRTICLRIGGLRDLEGHRLPAHKIICVMPASLKSIVWPSSATAN
jgi:hypothetical protein